MKQIKRYRRMHGWDYAKGASLFITVSTSPRRGLFGRIENGKAVLSPLGRIVDEALSAMPRLNSGFSLFGHVVMPDHVHFNCRLAPGLAEPLKTLGNAIRRFKNYTAKQARLAWQAEHSSAISTGLSEHSSAISTKDIEDGQTVFGQNQTMFGQNQTVFGQLWQQGYHDHLCLNRRIIESTERYIAYNPMKWALMHDMPESLKIREPLASPRLDIGDYWKGVGNTALLAPEERLVSLRVSMKVKSDVAVAALVRRMESAADKGYVIISGFISKGERAVCEMLAKKQGARFIRMLPRTIPNGRFKPESLYVRAFAEGRYLEIAKGNEEGEFGRAVCLDLNEEIVRIALAGEGIALHWREDGPHVQAEHSSAISAGLSEHSSAISTKDSGDGQTVFGQKEVWL